MVIQKPLFHLKKLSCFGNQMRLLQLHSDFVEYEPISKEINDAEEIISKSKTKLENLVVVLVTIEKQDDEVTALCAVEEMKQYLKTIGARKLLIYPYAHLSSNLSSPQNAFEVLKSLERIAKDSLIEQEVYRAPFGWTKAFDIKVKGHPLAENSKTIITRKVAEQQKANQSKEEERPISTSVKNNNILSSNAQLSRQKSSEQKQVSLALNAEERLQSSWYILDPKTDRSLTPIDQYKFKSQEENLQKLVDYEKHKKRAVDEQPPHVRLMKRLVIADYEPASDVGNMRYYPKGKLMKSLIEHFVTKRIIEYGGIEVETPIMYDSKHPSMQSYFNRFPARQYNLISDDKQLFLRFAACFGQFLIAKDLQLSYKHLPLRLYELTRYSFRKEKSGELVGLRRLRAFSMPDCHAFCKDISQAKEELLRRFELSLSVIDGVGLSPKDDLEMAIRVTEDFYEKNKDFVFQIASKFGKPILVEVWKEKFFYFVLKWEFNFVDNSGKASALSTDQIDVENANRYQIEFVDEDGSKKNPIILHNSPSGAVERVIYALLEKASKISRAGGVSSLPLWLAHTQVRLIPVSKQHIEFCQRIADKLSVKKIRADIDDRDESVSKRIRDSESEWIRYTLVIGEKEVQTQKFVVRDRNERTQHEIDIEELVKEINNQTNGKPYLPLNLPRNLSARPQIMV
jgi:threonyl-tRNA synthetase